MEIPEYGISKNLTTPNLFYLYFFSIQLESRWKQRLTFVQCDFSWRLRVGGDAGDVVLPPRHPMCCYIHDEVRFRWGNFEKKKNLSYRFFKSWETNLITHTGQAGVTQILTPPTFGVNRYGRNRMQRWTSDIADPLLIYHWKRNTKHSPPLLL